MSLANGAPEVAEGRVLLCVGTTKGLWIFASDDRRNWTQHGPFLAGVNVPAVLLYQRSEGYRLVSPARDAFWGVSVKYSDDLGTTWTESEQNPRFAEDQDTELKSIWALEARSDGTLFAGVEPASIFTSTDGGNTWSLLESLWNHPHRSTWQPGGGGLCLHSIRFDPRDAQRTYIAISTGGLYRSDDGGESWQPRNKGIAADFLPGDEPEYGQCVHKFDISPSQPDRIYLQNHGGVYRSDDGGETWEPREAGLPGNFGFPVVAHARDPLTAYVIPLDDREGMPRWTFEGELAVYRTRDGGESWHPLTNGLPQSEAFMTVLRDGMCADGADPLGVYFGTKSGHVYHSADEGEQWQLLADKLPPVQVVKAFQL